MKNIPSTSLLKGFLAGCMGILLVTACGKDFLDTQNTDKLSPTVFPTKLIDLDYMLFDVYGRLRSGYYNAYPHARIAYSHAHESDQAYLDNEFNAGQQINHRSTGADVGEVWQSHYENIAKANEFLSALERFKSANPNLLTNDVNNQLNYKEGEARFLRAWNYYHLVNLYGETFITNPGDAGKRGVPIREQNATSLEETPIARATIGQNWEYIINDLKLAEGLLAGKNWSGEDKGRVGIWAVKSFLGKAYVFTRQWAEAKAVLREVIDNSGKKLLPYDTYRNMFNGSNELNEESIFEIIYNDQQIQPGAWGNQSQAITYLGVLLSPTYMTTGRTSNPNGFGNYIIHDKNLPRYGYNFPRIDERRLKRSDGTFSTNCDTIQAVLGEYLAHSRNARQQKTVDPRLWVNALQPYADSITTEGGVRPVVKNRGEGTDMSDNYAWSLRKFTLTYRHIWAGPGASLGNNMYWLRLADVYLLYAEAAANTGDNVNALEYINKVKRRAYNLPVDVPAPDVDYASLAAKTMASDPVLGNDPLRYERWAELFGEGHWWFDVCRWKLGDQEAGYYQAVGSGNLTWSDRNYALPIPQSELNANGKMEQNPGY